MKSIYTHQDSNIAKTWGLMAVFLVIIIALGYGFSYFYNAPEILYFAVFFSLFMNVFSYWFSDKIALAVSGAKPATREEFFDLYTVTENLCIGAGLPTPKIYVINDSAPNAFATGRNKENSAVAVTSGLLNILDRSELEGVIAHELSHIGNRDILLSTIVVVLVGFIALLSDMFMRMGMFGGGDRDNKASGVIALVGIVLAILAPIVATIIQLAISRKREFLADASGALLTRYPEGLASALEKISKFNMPLKKANNATAHLYISNPFGANKKTLHGLHKLFMTHPPIDERIKVLRSMN
jgi:heat shock protein HtpX